VPYRPDPDTVDPDFIVVATGSRVALIGTNILALTSTAFNAALSGLMGTALGVRTVSSMMQSRIAGQEKAIKKHQSTPLKRKAATRKFSQRLAGRTKRVAAKSIAAIPAESIPFIGVAVLIADTGYELYASCEAVKDLDQLYSDLDIADETPDNVMHSVCDPELPDAGEVWGEVVEKSGAMKLKDVLGNIVSAPKSAPIFSPRF